MSTPRIFDSMAQAAAALRVPVSKLRRLKAQGAPGFKSGRVYPDLLIPWLRSRKAAPKTKMPPTPGEKLRTGAAAALVRLEGAEADAFATLQAAIAVGDEDAVEAARNAWLKVGDSLRRYDIGLEAARRETELVSKAEVQQWLANLIWSWRMTLDAFADSNLSEIMNAQGNADAVSDVWARLARKDFLLAVSTYLGQFSPPPWVAEAFGKGCDEGGTVTAERVEAIKKVFAAIQPAKGGGK